MATLPPLDPSLGRFERVTAVAARQDAIERLRSGDVTLEGLAAEAAFDLAVARLPLSAAVAAAYGFSARHSFDLLQRSGIRRGRGVGWLMSPRAQRQTDRLRSALAEATATAGDRPSAIAEAPCWPFDLVAA